MNIILMDVKWVQDDLIGAIGTYVGSSKDNRAVLFVKGIGNVLVSCKSDTSVLELGREYSCCIILYRRYIRDKNNKFVQTGVSKYIAELI